MAACHDDGSAGPGHRTQGRGLPLVGKRSGGGCGSARRRGARRPGGEGWRWAIHVPALLAPPTRRQRPRFSRILHQDTPRPTKGKASPQLAKILKPSTSVEQIRGYTNMATYGIGGLAARQAFGRTA
jgi:hypothetical protein